MIVWWILLHRLHSTRLLSNPVLSGGNADEEIRKKLDLVLRMLNGIGQEIKSEMRLP